MNKYEYKIIADSSCELPSKYAADERFAIVPFRMEIDGYPIRDSKNINIKELLDRIAKSKSCPRSACPSPDLFLKHFEGSEKRIYIITVSAKLSGCYNSAMLAKRIYEESHDDKIITVIDSKSASGGECLIALKALELEELGLPGKEIQDYLADYRDHMFTYVVLDNIETLRKNGRLSRLKAIAANSFNIKPLLSGKDGEIVELGHAVGLRKTWQCMVSKIEQQTAKMADTKNRVLIITHCNNERGAKKVCEMLKKHTNFKDYIIMNTSGLSSLYANDGGIIVAY